MTRESETNQTVKMWRYLGNAVLAVAPFAIAFMAWSMPAKVREVVAGEVKPVEARLASYVELVRYEREQNDIKAMITKLDAADRESRDRQEAMHRELVDLIHALDKRIAESK